MNDEEIKVSELDLASEIRDTDQIMIVQGGSNKKILGSYINEHGVIVSSIVPDTTQKVWFKKGKNLFNINSMIELVGSYRAFSNGQIVSSSTYNGFKIPVKPNTTYTITINANYSNLCYWNASFTRIDGEAFSHSGGSGTLTTPANCYYITLAVQNNFTQVMLNEGDIAETYEPYIRKAININGEDEYYTNDYSVAEQVIGKWIDGKPIYRKVVDYYPTELIGAGGTTTNVQVPHNISDFSQIINCRVVTGTNHVFPTLASSTGSTLTAGNAVIQVNSTNIILRIINDSWSSRHFYFILEYTKTTD